MSFCRIKPHVFGISYYQKKSYVLTVKLQTILLVFLKSSSHWTVVKIICYSMYVIINTFDLLNLTLPGQSCTSLLTSYETTEQGRHSVQNYPAFNVPKILCQTRFSGF